MNKGHKVHSNLFRSEKTLLVKRLCFVGADLLVKECFDSSLLLSSDFLQVNKTLITVFSCEVGYQHVLVVGSVH